MKRLFAFLFAVLMCLTLCACGAEKPSIVGTWEGSGTVSIIGENAPAPEEIIERWTFHEDGTVAVEVITSETMFPAAEYAYTLEKGVLTLTFNGRSVEFACTLDAETMTLEETLVFTHVK